MKSKALKPLPPPPSPSSEGFANLRAELGAPAKGLTGSPARLTGLSFLTLILVGTMFLLLPAATTGLGSLSVIDALFTATSAVCVTGLTVQDTATYFSAFGQIVILLLIQLGGLGIMTLSASLPVLFGRQLKLSRRSLFQGLLDQSDYMNLRETLRSIIRYTLMIEGVGALILSLRWYALLGNGPRAIYLGIFHAVSAFCNAGFALFSNNLIPFRSDPVITLTISFLIIFGGLGFVVVNQIFTVRGFNQYSFHTKLTLWLTGFLLLLPFLFIFFTEFSTSFLHFSLKEKVLTAFFQAVVPRTAGFNTIDLTLLGDATIFLMIILMFIGAAPGGTGGGVKVTTVGILLLSVRSIVSGRENIEIFKRRLSQTQIVKAVAILAISFMIVTFFIIVLMLTENAPFKSIMFETVSAFGTVGLSLNFSPLLSSWGKILISMVMFIGRIGPLTLVFLLGESTERYFFKYPEEKVMIG